MKNMTTKYIWVAKWVFWINDTHWPPVWGVYSSLFTDFSEPKRIGDAYTSEDRAYDEVFEYITTWKKVYEFNVIEHPNKLSPTKKDRDTL
jgi:hypothetical protein